MEKRIASIESFRVLAIFCVICIHTEVFQALAGSHFIYKSLYLFIQYFSLFAVPFFFMTSGYFFGKALEKGERLHPLLLRHSKKLLLLLLSWSVIYALIPTEQMRWFHWNASYGSAFWRATRVMPKNTLEQFSRNPIGFIVEGTKYHLWFLESLVLALWILAAFIKLNMRRFLLFFGACLFIFAMAADAYEHTPIGIGLPEWFDWERGPFTSTLFVALGFWFSGREKPQPKMALSLAIGGLLLQIIESQILRHFFNMPEANTGFATVLFSVGMFLVPLSLPKMGENTFLPWLAKMTLGVYMAHVLVLDALFPLSRFVKPVVWPFIYPLLVYILTVAIVVFLRQWKYTKPLVF